MNHSLLDSLERETSWNLAWLTSKYEQHDSPSPAGVWAKTCQAISPESLIAGLLETGIYQLEGLLLLLPRPAEIGGGMVRTPVRCCPGRDPATFLQSEVKTSPVPSRSSTD